MNEEHRNSLERSLNDICEELDAEDVFPYLISKGVVQEVQSQEIMSIAVKSTQTLRLITLIQAAGPSAFQELINALDTCNKGYLADKILPHLSSLFTQQLTSAELTTTRNSIFQGTSCVGPPAVVPNSGALLHDIYGGTIHINIAHGNMKSGCVNELPQTSFVSSTNLSLSNTIDWHHKLETVQTSLKEIYLETFKKTNPFSVPFTFDIERTWVPLALQEDTHQSQATENHRELLRNAFAKQKMLIIEGKSATGKTYLMRKLAYEWANGKQELSHFDLIVYAEFREVREQTFESIADLVLGYIKDYIEGKEFTNLKSLLSDRNYCKQRNILLLLDGYDESSLNKQCNELTTYLASTKIKKPLVFNIVLTTRPGYLSEHRGKKGRHIFADILGFTSEKQKESYISNHFSNTPQNERQNNIKVICNLLNTNKNLNNLAETPLFLTFICLVHERIVDGTLLELYCNIIWWLIDRHQRDFPDRDIPALFGFHSDSSDKFGALQDHFLHFPQLHCLGNMAMCNLGQDIFAHSDCAKFTLQPIIEQVGLLRKERKFDKSSKLVSSFHFPHRTIQEFLAAFYCFCSNDATYEWLLPNSKLDTSERGKNEFETFLLRIALSNNMPINIDKRKYYFERIADIYLNITFDAFNTTAGFNNKLLNWFLSQCNNVQRLTLNGELKSGGYARDMLNDTSIPNESVVASRMSILPLLSFDNLMKLGSLTFANCIFEASFQLSFTNFSSLKNLQFSRCEIKNGTNLKIATLPAIETVGFWLCIFELVTWESITNAIKNSPINYLKLTFEKSFNQTFLDHLKECSNVEKMEIAICDNKICQKDLLSFNDLMKLQSVSFAICTFEANSQLSFKNCPSLKDLKFTKCGIYNSTKLDISTLSAIETVKFHRCSLEAYSQLSLTNCVSLKNLEFSECEIKSNTIDGITTLPAIATVEFYKCKIDSSIWEIITDQIRSSPIKCLKLSADYFVKEINPEFLHHLHKCDRINEIHVKDAWNSNINDYILNRYENEVTANLVLTAQKLLRLRSITIGDESSKLDESRRLQERNKERIEKAGQERNIDFSIKYVE